MSEKPINRSIKSMLSVWELTLGFTAFVIIVITLKDIILVHGYGAAINLKISGYVYCLYGFVIIAKILNQRINVLRLSKKVQDQINEFLGMGVLCFAIICAVLLVTGW